MDPRLAPLRVLGQPLLGDPVMLLSEPPTTGGLSAAQQLELRVAILEGTVAELQQQIRALEAQTLQAYWDRAVQWLWSLWPWH